VRHFQQDGLVELVVQVLEETGLPAEALELEITETTAMQNLERTVHILNRLHEVGVRIAIDDFGTGYSSLIYLRQFPISTLKIDRSFIHDILADSDGGSIVEAIISTTHSLQRRVIAEAVETEEQLHFLRSHDCDQVQGFLFSRPVPAGEVVSLVRQLSAPEAAGGART
jgi:EAL domain-containing protein (putative c-di-GMP-specific phosphodiesterase class I)